MRISTSITSWQVIACLLGVVACAVPCSIMHRGFWDFGFSVMRSDSKGIRIEEIKPNTPAAALREGDRIIAINGQPDAIYDIHRAWRAAPVGSEVEFRVLRGEPTVGDDGAPPHPIVRTAEVVMQEPAQETVLIKRVADPVAGIIYWNWQMVAGITLVGLSILSLVTRSFPRAGVARGLILVVAAIGLVFVVLPASGAWTSRWIVVWQDIAWSASSEIANFGWQKITILTTCAALATLGIADLWTCFRPSQSSRPAEPTAAPEQA